MLLNYLKLSIRLLIRNPFFTLINVAGLSVGFAMFLILWPYSTYELKSDQFHTDYKRIYRLYSNFHIYTGIDWNDYLFAPLPPVFTSIAKEKFTEIESTTRVFNQKNFNEIRWAGPQTDTAAWSQLNRNVEFSHIGDDGEKYSFKEENAAYADPNLFTFFSIPMVSGSPENVLSRADAIVLSSSTAKRYFGENDPMGKVVSLNDSASFTVTGLFEDLPENTHLNFEMVMSALRIQHATENVEPFQQSAHSYFKIREGSSISNLEDKFNQEQLELWDFTKWQDKDALLTFYLQPLEEVPFRVFDDDVFIPKSKYVLQAFRVVAILVLLMAWVNYLNLKLSTQSKRMKELATRKTAGARKIDFIKQFCIESLVINLFSLIVALTLIQLLRDPLELLFQFYMPEWDKTSFSSLAIFISLMFPGIFIAGLHPAVHVWRMTTNNILRYNALHRRRLGFTDVSAVLQFVCAIGLIVWMFCVVGQVDFVTRDNWGLDRNRVVVIDLPNIDSKKLSVPLMSFKDQLRSLPGVEDVALSTTIAGDLLENRFGFNRMDGTGLSAVTKSDGGVDRTIESKQSTKHGLWAVTKSDGGVDERFIPFYGLKVLAGRNFLRDNPADRSAVILSRVAAKSVGWEPEEAIGKIIKVEKHSWRPFFDRAEVIGVIEDHRYSPLYPETGMGSANPGTALTYGDYLRSSSKPAKLSVRINGPNPENTIAAVERQYHKIFPGEIFQWYFLNDYMNVHYEGEKTARNQITLFTIIAIGIACLGLLGMITNKAVEKTKEIGIRKVLGAQLRQIALLLLSTTLNQVIIATAIGIPMAYYITQQYLEKFSERISLHWWHFALPVVILVLIMFATISSVLWKAARSNPVEALKYE